MSRNSPGSIERRNQLRIVSSTLVTRYECINGNGTPYLIEHAVRPDGTEDWQIWAYRYDPHAGSRRMRILDDECKRPVLRSLRRALESHKQEIEKGPARGA